MIHRAQTLPNKSAAPPRRNDPDPLEGLARIDWTDLHQRCRELDEFCAHIKPRSIGR